jgi:uncharacterized membrane protein YeaQ/YmgE (transglycosylase-associated protein family)
MQRAISSIFASAFVIFGLGSSILFPKNLLVLTILLHLATGVVVFQFFTSGNWEMLYAIIIGGVLFVLSSLIYYRISQSPIVFGGAVLGIVGEFLAFRLFQTPTPATAGQRSISRGGPRQLGQQEQQMLSRLTRVSPPFEGFYDHVTNQTGTAFYECPNPTCQDQQGSYTGPVLLTEEGWRNQRWRCPVCLKSASDYI